MSKLDLKFSFDVTQLVPSGWDIDTANSTFENIVLVQFPFRRSLNIKDIIPKDCEVDEVNSTFSTIVFKKKKKKVIYGHIHKGSVDKQSRSYKLSNPLILTSGYSDIESTWTWDKIYTDKPNPTDWVSAPEDVGGETRREVKTFEVDYTCPECKEGRMRRTGVTYFTDPLQYPHKCTKCGHTENFFGVTYPYIEHV